MISRKPTLVFDLVKTIRPSPKLLSITKQQKIFGFVEMVKRCHETEILEIKDLHIFQVSGVDPVCHITPWIEPDLRGISSYESKEIYNFDKEYLHIYKGEMSEDYILVNSNKINDPPQIEIPMSAVLESYCQM